MDQLEAQGYTIVSPILAPNDVAALITEFDRVFALTRPRRAGVRGLVAQSDRIRQFAESGDVQSLVGDGFRIVRSIGFDKTPDANWDVIWHQDVTIAVEERRDVPGFGPWSTKDGLPHVQPPADVLARMVTLRLHLDACGEENGPLLVVPASHRRGALDVQSLDAADCDARAVACHVEAGGCVLMKPLTLHASRKALRPDHRRVIHLEFSRDSLPGGLQWARH